MTLVKSKGISELLIVEPSITDYHHLMLFCLYLLQQKCLINTTTSENKLIVIRVKSPINGTLITIMVTSNETNVRFKPLLILNKNFCRPLTEIKSVWLVMREAGDAVCGVV